MRTSLQQEKEHSKTRGGCNKAAEQNVRSLHGLGSEGLDLTDSSGGSLLEGDTIQALAHVDGIIPGDNISLGLSLSFFGHCKEAC